MPESIEGLRDAAENWGVSVPRVGDDQDQAEAGQWGREQHVDGAAQEPHPQHRAGGHALPPAESGSMEKGHSCGPWGVKQQPSFPFLWLKCQAGFSFCWLELVSWCQIVFRLNAMFLMMLASKEHF